jgi:hypothetical protein
MRIFRGALAFVAIIALLALTMGAGADLLPFEIMAPLWFFVAAVVVALCVWRDDVRADAVPCLTSVALRAPPLQ